MHAENPLNEYKLEQVLREEEKEEVGCKASLNESFMILNIINFADVTRREKVGVSWDVRRVSSP